jgi:hypothetical protein
MLYIIGQVNTPWVPPIKRHVEKVGFGPTEDRKPVPVPYKVPFGFGPAK